MSTEFVHSIDYSKDSCIVEFGLDDEIKYTDESIDQFCEKFEKIIELHLYQIWIKESIREKISRA